MSRLREALERIEQRAAAASAGHQPALRVDKPAERPVPASNVFAAASAPAPAPRSTAVTLVIEPASDKPQVPAPAPSAGRTTVPPAAAVPTMQPAFAHATFAEVADSPLSRVDTPRIDPPQRLDAEESAVRTADDAHLQTSPHVPAENWKPAMHKTPEESAKKEEIAGDTISAKKGETGVPTNAVASAPTEKEITEAAEDRPTSVEQRSTADTTAHPLTASDLIIPAAPPETNGPNDPSEVSIHPPSPIASPHIPASRFAPAESAAVHTGLDVPKPFQQTCRKILAALPDGDTHALLFAAIDTPYTCASTVASLASAMTDQIDAPILAIDASRDAALTKQLRVKSTNALMRILRGTTSWEDCIVQTQVPGLCLLPSKPGQDRVAPFAFQRLLTELKGQFGLLLIDVGAFDETTALSLAGLCSATYLTVRQGHTTKDRARAAQRQIKSNGASLAGCVMISPVA